MSSSAIPQSMRAWLYEPGRGAIEDKLKLQNDVPLPKAAGSLAKEQVLVKVLAMSANPIDYKLAEIPIISRVALGTPSSPGLDFAGTVVATGSAQQSLKPGQRVLGRLDGPAQYGTLCEYVVADAKGTVPISNKIKAEDAAAATTTALTAYQTLVPFLKEGQSVFINGGSGGVGTYGIQIAKAIGCHVTTCCSGANIDLCKSVGADEVIDYHSKDVVEELKKGNRRYDLIVDNVGTTPLLYWQCSQFTTPKADYVQVGAAISLGATLDMAKRKLWPSWLGGAGRPWQFAGVGNKQEDFLQIGRWMEEGKVKSVVDEVFAYDNAPRAYAKLKTGRARGNIVVTVADE